ncbi:metalloregulator ArsR/SmtB family transcription factor [Svornostia abyssi]|uniref:Metalloregulator ArsR/SmtB family transcription factor n=1 Tax=Svornostia abyssi TaxID=2898438 RepID=A0ABY5PIG9_9ACTN|nr:metalloregulator ArsR/SmtB family transcription factor [Parviterribacteraceae bacterium J379]
MTNAVAAITALADPTRRKIFERIAAHPSAVGALADGLPVSRPAVSQHLRVLKDAGLVDDEAQGTRRIYRVRQEGLADVRAYLDQFWDQSLAAFRDLAESEDA